MTLKWNRESLLILLTLVMVLVALFYYGNRLFIEPVKVTADTSSQLVTDQEVLLNTFPPSDTLRTELEEEYENSSEFIPSGERINEAIVMIEQIAESNDVRLLQMSQLNEQQPVEGLSDLFMTSTYQIDMESTSAASLRGLLSDLSEQDRLWNSQTFSYQRDSEDILSGSLSIDLYYHVTSVN